MGASCCRGRHICLDDLAQGPFYSIERLYERVLSLDDFVHKIVPNETNIARFPVPLPCFCQATYSDPTGTSPQHQI